MKPEDILRDGADTFEQKTADYGRSWQKIGSLLWELNNGEPIVLDSPEKVISFGLFTRRFDKIAREFNGTFQSNGLNFEATEDSAMDESVYAAMSASNIADMHAAEGYRAAADGGSRRFVNVNADYTPLTDTEWAELEALLDELDEAEEASDHDVNAAVGEDPDLPGMEADGDGWHATRDDIQSVFERGDLDRDRRGR